MRKFSIGTLITITIIILLCITTLYVLTIIDMNDQENELVISSVVEVSDLMNSFIYAHENDESEEAIYLLGRLHESSNNAIELLSYYNRNDEEIGKYLSDIWLLTKDIGVSKDDDYVLDDIASELNDYNREYQAIHQIAYLDVKHEDKLIRLAERLKKINN